MWNAGRRHIDREYEAELESLRKELLRMAGRVEEMIEESVHAFESRDAELAQRTLESDHRINQAERDLDERCLIVLAKRQPMGSDLRFITLCLKMVTDLERIADLAVNLCERTLQLAALPPVAPALDGNIARMASIVRSMVKDAIDAFVRADVVLAEDVLRRDDEVDELYHRSFRKVLARMVQDAALVERGIHVQSAAKFLERMGDHATNLAEQVVFMVKGTDIRHAGKLEGPAHGE